MVVLFLLFISDGHVDHQTFTWVMPTQSSRRKRNPAPQLENSELLTEAEKTQLPITQSCRRR
jgi:hypothetical protein